MSITLTTDVFCDGCGTWEPNVTQTSERSRVRAARQLARQFGWVCSSHADWCPDCVALGTN